MKGPLTGDMPKCRHVNMQTATATPPQRALCRVREHGRRCRCINTRHKRGAAVHQKAVRSSVADSEQPPERDLMATGKSVEFHGTDNGSPLAPEEHTDGDGHGDVEAGRGSWEATSPVPAPRGERLVSLDVFRGVTVAVSKLSSSSSPPVTFVPTIVHRMQACSLVDDLVVVAVHDLPLPGGICSAPSRWRRACRENERASDKEPAAMGARGFSVTHGEYPHKWKHTINYLGQFSYR
jgi:hypothetical protein